MKVRFLPVFTAILILMSCSGKKESLSYQQFARQDRRIVIWTNCREFAQYIELFNATSRENRAVLVYKENPAFSLPPAKDELTPDIVIGSWLRSDFMQKEFCRLDYLFNHQNLTTSMFYKNLLDSGKHHSSQYLIPVSFNLPAVIFDKSNTQFVTDNYMLTLDEIKTTASEYNQKKADDKFQRIGFAPLNNNSFLSLTAKLFNTDFREVKGQIIWNEQNLNNSVSFLKNWIEKENQSAQVEEDFAFKYLFMPYYRQVLSGRTLFATTQSQQIFKLLHEQELNIDYRWIVQDGKIFMDDSFVMMGIYKKAQNISGASEFITWFCQAETQKKLLERKEAMNLETELFGIADGFSAVRGVTEHILPTFYTQLLSNLPPAQMLEVPQKLPPRWESYKTQVVEPFIRDQISEQHEQNKKPLAEYEREWRKKVFAD